MMNRIALGLGFALLAGCPAEDTDTDTGGDTCANTIISGSEFPAQGATNAYYRTTIEAKLQIEEATAAMSVMAGDVAVDGTSEVVGKKVIFTPSAPLSPSTTYTVTMDYCAGTPSWDFTTSAVGSATDAAALVDATYSLDLASGRFVKPEGIGGIIQQYLTTSVLVGVTGSSSTTIDMIGAIATDAGAQDTCAPSIPFPTADFSADPFFAVGPETTTLNVQGYSLTIDDLYISGAFSPDGSYIAGAVLKGVIDTRPLVPLINPDPTAADDEICNLAQSTLGVGCEPCADGGVFCLGLFVDSISAEKVTTGALIELRSPMDTTAPGTDYCTQSECQTNDGAGTYDYPECAPV